MFDVLRDMRVLDFGKFVAAPSATWLLSNMGAQVIKVEPVAGAPDREPFRIATISTAPASCSCTATSAACAWITTSPEGRSVLDEAGACTPM